MDVELSNESFYQEDEMGVALDYTGDDEIVDGNALYYNQCETVSANEVSDLVLHRVREEENEEEVVVEEEEEEEEEEESERDEDDD